MKTIREKTLDELENFAWGEADASSYLVKKSHALRQKPIGALTTEELSRRRRGRCWPNCGSSWAPRLRSSQKSTVRFSKPSEEDDPCRGSTYEATGADPVTARHGGAEAC
jgi:hypothetical protein